MVNSRVDFAYSAFRAENLNLVVCGRSCRLARADVRANRDNQVGKQLFKTYKAAGKQKSLFIRSLQAGI